MDDSNEQRRLLLSSDREMADQLLQNHHNVAQNVLDEIGAFLEQADEQLDHLDQEEDKEGLLSSAIVRGCEDLAGAVRSIADELDKQSTEERRALAEACVSDIQASQEELRLLEGSEGQERQKQLDSTADKSPEDDEFSNQLETLLSFDTNDMIRVIETAKNFLRDVEASLMSFDQDAAEELAEVGLTVARLFVASLQSFHSQITPQDLMNGPAHSTQNNRSRGVEIELLDEHGNATRELPKVESRSRSFSTQTQKSSKQKKSRTTRIRVLWPPLGPHVSKCLQWAKGEASKHPMLSVALGIVMFPAVIPTAILGTSLVWVDGFVQDFYNHFEDASLIVGLERGAAQLYHTGRLAFISSKLVTRQSLMVLQKQLERHGGAGKIAQNCVGMAVDRIVHPIETIQGACSGVAWSVDQIKRLVEELQDHERQEAVQELQT